MHVMCGGEIRNFFEILSSFYMRMFWIAAEKEEDDDYEKDI